jgi:hypothetical protein
MIAEQGYIYRLAPITEQRLRALIAEHVGDAGWTFGGASQWDFDPHLEDKRKNLREVAPIGAAQALSLSGDFGHAFAPAAEVRWKRRDDGAYDVLVLSEAQLTIAGAAALYAPHLNSATSAREEGGWTVRRPDAAAIRQTAGRPSIAYIDYLAPNGAVQFQRLVRVYELP